jgi:hypothetical protein
LSHIGSSYSVTLSASVAIGVHPLVFSAVGLNPDGTLEAAQTLTQAITVYPANTPLVIGSVTGPASYTVGPPQTYSAQVIDPDGVASVTATLDGINIPVVASGAATYSVAVPANTPVGDHALVFTGVGQLPSGSLEAPHSVTQYFTVYSVNTSLVIGPVTGPASYTVGAPQTYSTQVIDPDGVASVTATLDGVNIPVVASGTDTYSVAVTVNTPTGSHALVFIGVGRLPNGALEQPQSVTQNFTVYPPNTALTLSTISRAITNSINTYNVTVVDPDGILSVTATWTYSYQGLPPVTQTQTVTRSGSAYSITKPYICSGISIIEFTATGLNPDGTPEAPQKQSVNEASFC